MAGFRWQVVHALLQALKMTPEQVVSIEQEDDVAILQMGGACSAAIQLKHSYDDSTIAETSPQWWKVIGVWLLSGVYQKAETLVCCTTDSIRHQSKLWNYYRLRDDTHLEPLRAAMTKNAEAKGNSDLEKAHDKWLELDSDDQLAVLRKIDMEDGSAKLDQAPTLIEQELERFTGNSKDIANLARNVRGWFETQIDEGLGKDGVHIQVSDLRSAITNLLRADRLIYAPDQPSTDEIYQIIRDENPILVQQLRLTGISEEAIHEQAVRDFRSAKKQRNDWLNDGALGISAVERFTAEVLAFWERKRLVQMREVKAGADLKTAGQTLFDACMDHNPPIASQYVDGQLSRGTFHGYADQPIIGWHPDFDKVAWQK